MNYRVATAADLPVLAAARWAFRAEDNEVPSEDQPTFTARFVDFVTAGMASGAWTYWIAEDGDEIVGQMAVCIVPSIPRPARRSDQWGYLTDVYTRPGSRNAGIGTALLGHVRNWGIARDLEFLLVWPSDASMSFYVRAGFESLGDGLRLTLRAYDVAPTPGGRE
jgi:GNAT superfamily N-acetyltransferase